MTAIYCTDIGNYSSITALKGDKPRFLRSVLADVTYSSARDFDTEDSPSIKIDGKTLLLGDRAIKSKSPQASCERGKELPEIVRPFTLQGLRQDFYGSIRYLVPERNHWTEDSIKQALVGIHSVEINGKLYSHNITDVQFFLETDIAVTHAYEKRHIDIEGDTLCIDIGGGTTNYVVMSPDSSVLTRRSIPKVGGVSLANDIINSDLMQNFAKRDGAAFKVPKLMDAIADGSFTYGRKYAFNQVFGALLENWFNNLMDSISTAANDYLSDVTNIMLIGGNANLVRTKLINKPGFYIPEKPELTNIEALLAL
ncbi:hypothetical protein H6G91_17185 [Nostoc muscorum FACHB-395]|jgi:hypothetical protein|nr:hypothetical protein [Desmonostoc muscorum FACHB-395]